MNQVSSAASGRAQRRGNLSKKVHELSSTTVGHFRPVKIVNLTVPKTTLTSVLPFVLPEAPKTGKGEWNGGQTVTENANGSRDDDDGDLNELVNVAS